MNFENEQATEKERLYIAYGSNLNLMQMSMRCPTALIHKTAELVDHELVFRGSKTGFYATVEPCEGTNVPVLLWKIQPADEERLDAYEGYPDFYDKENTTVTTADGEEIEAVIYTLSQDHALGMPTQHYIDVIVDGYEDAGFDVDILVEAIDRTYEKMEEEQNEEFKMDF